MKSERTYKKNTPVRLASAQLEELDYRKQYSTYSSRGRKLAVEPRVMFKVIVYGYQCGIYSSRKLEEACRYRVDFMWLLEDQETTDHTTIARFRTGRCREAVEDLFYQYIRKLEKMGETEHQSVFIDGIKLESRAERYTFMCVKAWKSTWQGKGTGTGIHWLYLRRAGACTAGGVCPRYPLCPRKRQAEKPGAEGMGAPVRAAGALGEI